MDVAALVMWVAAAIGGFYLLAVWLANDGLRQRTRFPVALTLGHPLLAMLGLIVWALYLFTARSLYAWAALGVLVVVVALGVTMLMLWLTGRGSRRARGAEQSFPVLVVVIHGVAGIFTFVLVFLTVTSVS